MAQSNMTLISGVLLGLAVLAAAVGIEIGSEAFIVLFHPVAIIVVFGGTLTAALIARPMADLIEAVNVTFSAVFRPKDEFAATAVELIRLSKVSQTNPLMLDDAAKSSGNPLIAEALQTLSMGFPKEEVRRHLERRRDDNESSLIAASDLFLWLGRLGPAFGLLGTLLGLIALLYFQMASQDMSRIASSMGVALTATLYGVSLSNLIFGPLGEYLHSCAQKSARLDEIVLDGALMLRERRGPVYMLQSLRVSLPRHALTEFDNGVGSVFSANSEEQEQAQFDKTARIKKVS
jgi:chemotaxis protein MotA